MVKALRRLLSLALVAGLTLMNVRAAALHVHATVDHLDGAHHHGPASHHHDVSDRHSSDSTQVSGVDADDTVVHAALAAAFEPTAKPLQGADRAAPAFDRGVPSIVDAARIVARAHGPPSLVQPSLRAPPALPSW